MMKMVLKIDREEDEDGDEDESIEEERRRWKEILKVLGKKEDEKNKIKKLKD